MIRVIVVVVIVAIIISRSNINISNISYSINGKFLLNRTSLDISGNGITVVLGANGAGKTTLLRVLLGLIPLNTGIVFKKPKLIFF